jgi:hypothetical protein
MATNLQDAISLLLAKVQADGSVLDVADAAIKLAKGIWRQQSRSSDPDNRRRANPTPEHVCVYAGIKLRCSPACPAWISARQGAS